MTIPQSPARSILTSFAAYLASAGVGAYRPSGPAYTDDEVVIVMGTERPIDNAQVILNWVSLDDDIEITQGSGLLAIAMKGTAADPLSVDDLSWAVFDALHGLTTLSLGDASLTDCWRQSSVPMGQDDKLRKERTDQYAVAIEFPPTSHRP